MGEKREKKEIPKKHFENFPFCEQGKKKEKHKQMLFVQTFWDEFSL